MRNLAVLVVACTYALFGVVTAQTTTSSTPAGCAAQGDLHFICGQHRPEDLVRVPGKDWVIASWLAGGISAINLRDKTTTILYPSPTAGVRFDKATYDTCPGAPDAEEQSNFAIAGLAIQPDKHGTYTLYAVEIGKQAAIQVFELDVRGKAPAVTWIGCAVANGAVFLNSVVPLPEGGFISTHFTERGEGADASRAKMLKGEVNGEALEWHTGKGWTKVPGSEVSGANGVEVSADGKVVFVDGWGSQSFIRLSRGTMPPKRDEIPVGFRIDNVRFAPDGQLLAAGQAEHSTRVIKIDPQSLKVTPLFDIPDTVAFEHGSVALQVNDEIWVGSSRTGLIAVLAVPK